MPEQFKNEDDRVGSYRNYINRSKGYAVWRYTKPPDWWSEEVHLPVRIEYLNLQESKKISKKIKNEQHSVLSATLQSGGEV